MKILIFATLLLAVSAQAAEYEDITLNIGDIIDYAQDVKDRGYKSFELKSQGSEESQRPILKEWNGPVFDPKFNGAINRARTNGVELHRTSVPTFIKTILPPILVLLAMNQFGQILTAVKFGKTLLLENPLFDNFFDEELERALDQHLDMFNSMIEIFEE